MKIAAGILLFTVSLFGQAVPGRYILELSGEPAATSASVRAQGLSARRAAVRARQLDVRRQVPQHGGQVIESLDTVYNGLIVTVPEARAAELAQIPGVVKVHRVLRVRPVLDHALPLHKVPDAWATLPLGQNSAGAGVKIAMIDSGIDVNHAAFAVTLPPVDGFPKVSSDADKAFTNSKIIVAKNYTSLLGSLAEPNADDTDGHGSGTSMAAAGGPVVSPYGPMSGVAPGAYLGNYKVLASGSSSTDLIAKAIDDAVADGMDIVNISLGSFVTSFADIAPDEPSIASIEAASRAGVVVVVSAGNSGPGATTIGNFASAPSAVAVGSMLNDRVLFYSASISGVPPYVAFPGDGPDPAQKISGPLFDVSAVDPTGLACSPLPAGSVTGMVVLVQRGNCNFEDKINNVAGGGGIAALVYNSPTGTPTSLTMAVGGATLPAMFVNNPEGLDLKSRLAASSGLQITLDFLGVTPFAVTPGLSDFSSRGPGLGTTLKPDMVAVGEEIVTGAQKTYPDGESYDPSGYIDTAGTSFSAPLVTGAAAVLKSAHPGLTAQQYRSLLINYPGTIANFDGTATTVSQAGSGMLNLGAAIKGTISANPTSLSFGTGSGTINTTVNLTLANVGTSGDTFKITAKPAGGPAPTIETDTIQLDPNGSRQIPITVNASGLAPGEYQGSLQVAGTGGSTATIPYWFAVPGTTPNGISIVYSDFFDFSRSTAQAAIVFRVVDAAGLPLATSDTPKAAISAGGGTVRTVYKAGDIPGTWAIDLRTGTSDMQIDITIGNVTQSVVIPIF